jgi:nucleotide-binding universal stress UspA family protein
MPKGVVIGYIDSPEGEDALGLGHQLARAIGGAAILTVVVEHPRHGVDEEQFEAAVSEYCGRLLAKAGERLQDLEVLERPLVGNSRSRAIYELAEEDQPAAIVIGSTHRGPIGRVLLGTLGDSLLAGAPCAVAIAPRGYAAREQGLERIGIAVDGSSESWRALGAGAELAGRLEVPLRLLSAVDPPPYVLGGLLSDLDPDQYREHKEREAEDLLAAAAARVLSEVLVEREVLHGSPAEALVEAAEGLDLLIMGSRGYGPIKHTLLGSVSAKVIASAPCGLMVVARGAGFRPLGP